MTFLPAALLPVLCLSCGREAKIEAKSEPAWPATVAVARVVPSDLARRLALSAEFRPFQEVDVHAKVAGYVKQIYVDVGDRVKQGQRLAVLEIPEMHDDLARADAARKRSDAELLRARNELQRARSAHGATHLTYERLAAVSRTRPNLVAQQEIDEALAADRVSEAAAAAAEAALTAAEQQVRVSQADLEKSRTLMGYSEITAPFAGVITRRYADTGAMIQAGTASQTQAMPLVRVAEDDRLRLVLPVPESVVPRIHTGAPVEVRVSSLNRSFPGKVARFSSQVQFSTRTMETEVDVSNPRRLLVPGMFAEAVLTLDSRADVLTVPLGAIASLDKNPTVLLVNGLSRIEQRSVRLGLETPFRVEVLAGLRDKDLVVVGSRGQYRLGQKVEPRVVEDDELENH